MIVMLFIFNLFKVLMYFSSFYIKLKSQDNIYQNYFHVFFLIL